MTAQQQLAEYLADDAEARELGAPLYHMRAVEFLRDHGPAIAELIEALVLVNSATNDDQFLAARYRQSAALRKLTQEA